MAQIKVRYLVVMPGAAGALPRYFWQPSAKLRAAGWRPERVPANWTEISDPAPLQAAAIAAAQELNTRLDEARGKLAPAAQPGEVRQPPPRVPLAPPARRLRDLVAVYKDSPDWTVLAPATKRGYGQCLDKLEAWGGDVPVRAIGAASVQKLRAALAHTPAFANAVVRVLRLLLEHGRRIGWISVNPALRPGLVSSDPSGLIWPTAAVPVFVAAADRLGRHSIGTAVLLNEWLGQREGDVLRMPRSVLRKGLLWVRQNKTGAGVALPVGVVEHLTARLTAELARVDAVVDKFREAARKARVAYTLPTAIVIDEHTGLPYKADRFRHVFAEIRAAAAKDAPKGFEIDYLRPGRDMADPNAFLVRIEQLTFMQLRHTAVTRLGEAECDPQLISAVSGHSLATVLQILERYMVRTSKMATLAFEKRRVAEGLAAPAPAAKIEEAG